MFVPSHSSPRGRLLATLLAVAMPAAALPTPARAAPVLALLAGEKVSPEEAASARKSVQERAQGLRKSDAGAAAELLSEEAGTRSDPVLYLDAADAYREAGAKERSRPDLETGIEKARIGLDILYFLQDPRCDPDWQILDSGQIPAEIRRGEKIIAGAEQAIRDLEKKSDAAPVAAEEPKGPRKKAPRDGRGLIAGGSLLTVVGVAGIGMLGAGLATGASAQKDIENLNESDLDYQSQYDDIDAKGKLGNTLTYAGAVVGAVGLAAGIALLVVGVKKRKKYRAEHGSDETARLHLLPVAGRGEAGLLLHGRF